MEYLLIYALPCLFAILFMFMALNFFLLVDSLMDYGHILSFIREKAAVRALRRLKRDTGEFSNAVKQASDQDFVTRIHMMDKFYWTIAKDDARFLSIVCVKCLSLRYSLVLWLFTYIFYAWNLADYVDVHKSHLFVAYFISTFVLGGFFKLLFDKIN